MNTDDRPNPEQLLEAIKLEESRLERGSLKIFIGMSAGVGKTFAMLAEARQLKSEGVDVVVGIVATHGRKETAVLLEGLKVIAPKSIEYKGKYFDELNLDEILKIHPQIVLVDELAHSNIPSSRHPKRWQDIIELLDNGIDVYTTLNIQHIESLKDIIEGIVRIPIRETVPDQIVDMAAYIQLVDLTTDELLQRLKEGKVYLGGQSEIAARNFFQKDRLTALREMALRYAAEKVDHDLHVMVGSEDRVSEWKPRERLLVSISPSPSSQKLIRTGRRLASRLDAPWIVLHVQNGRILNESESAMLAKNLAMARDLGAEVLTTDDPDVAAGIQRVAHQKGVTQIIIGRSPKPSFFNFFSRHTLLDKLAEECSDIDVHVIRQEIPSIDYRKRIAAFFSMKQAYSYVFAFIYVWVLTGLSALAISYINYRVVGFVFLIGIMLLSIFIRSGPIIFASILFVLNLNYFFIPPEWSFSIFSNEDNILLVLYFITAVTTGFLVDRARVRKEMLTKREESTEVLYDIVREIASAPSLEDLLQSVKERLGVLINGYFEILIKQVDNGIIFDKPMELISDEKEKNAAIWVFNNGREAGWSTTTLPANKNLYIPLKGHQEVVGVLVYRPKADYSLTTEEKNFLYTVGKQLSNYLERSFADEKIRQHQYLTQIEKIYQTVLGSLSHGLQSPLITIKEAVKALKVAPEVTEKKIVDRQVHRIENSSEGLLRVFDNVFIMAKLNTGLVSIYKQLHNVEDLLDVSYEKAQNMLGKRKLIIKKDGEFPLVPCDAGLIEILLNNLILNAISYSPLDSTIEIEAKEIDGKVMISVSDEGPGIPDDMLDAVFDKFYRVPGNASPGLGLGLAIAQRIAKIHQGHLIAQNCPSGGAKFSLFLPAET